MNATIELIYNYILVTVSESYLLIFMCFYTLIHVLHTRIIKRPMKLEEGVSYDLNFTLKNNEPDIITSPAFFVNLFSVIALPIAALSSSHYWGYLALSTLFIAFLFLSDVSFVTRNNRGNEGLVAYIIIPIWYLPASGISIVLYLFDIGTP